MPIAQETPRAVRSAGVVVFHLSSCVLVAALLASAPAHGGPPQVADIDTLTRCASVIFEGDVLDVSSAWNQDHNQIRTRVDLAVSQCYKGSTRGGHINIQFLGGTVDEITMAVLDQPTFSPGEHVFLFLAPNHEDRDVPLVAGDQGKLLVTQDPTSRAEMISSPYLSIPKADAVKRIDQIMQPVLHGSR